jgi:hypothetical protein
LGQLAWFEPEAIAITGVDDGQFVLIGQLKPVCRLTSSTSTRAAACSAAGRFPDRTTTVASDKSTNAGAARPDIAKPTANRNTAQTPSLPFQDMLEAYKANGSAPSIKRRMLRRFSGINAWIRQRFEAEK